MEATPEVVLRASLGFQRTVSAIGNGEPLYGKIKVLKIKESLTIMRNEKSYRKLNN